jgi:hypothetical protein
METVRLRKLLQPSQIEVLLEALVSRGNLLPKDCYRIRDPQTLPSQLQMIVARAVSEGRIWACWANAHYTWLFTSEMSLHLSRERGTPVLLVNRYSENGELEDTGPWMADAAGRWQRLKD